MRLEKILGSKNRVRVLRVLTMKDGTSGRKTALQAGLSPSAAMNALGELFQEGMVLRNGTHGKHLYKINRSHILWPSIEKLFGAETKLPKAVSDTIRMHFNNLGPVYELMAIGFVPDKGFYLSTHPRIELDGEPLRGLREQLKINFGTDIAMVVEKPESMAESLIIWSSTEFRRPVGAMPFERKKALNFFGLK